jgi:20S proteasome alpha/beta subunit
MDSTTIAIKCKDGVIMAVEKTLISKMLVPGTHRRVYAIDRHIGLSMAGLVADGRQLVNRAREEALSYKKNYGSDVPPHVLAERMGQFVHYYTLYGSVRPFGASIILAGYDVDEKKTTLHMIEPSGVTYVRTEVNKDSTRMNSSLTLMLIAAELPWLCDRQGPAGGQDRDRKVQALRSDVP